MRKSTLKCNGSGYSDPTARDAIGHVDAQRRRAAARLNNSAIYNLAELMMSGGYKDESKRR